MVAVLVGREGTLVRVVVAVLLEGAEVLLPEDATLVVRCAGWLLRVDTDWLLRCTGTEVRCAGAAPRCAEAAWRVDEAEGLRRTAVLPKVLSPERLGAAGAAPTRVGATLPCLEGAAPPWKERDDTARWLLIDRALVCPALREANERSWCA